MKLDNKVVLITGAGGGIGQAAVRKFVSEGAKVMLADIGTDVTQNWSMSLAPSTVPVSLSMLPSPIKLRIWSAPLWPDLAA